MLLPAVHTISSPHVAPPDDASGVRGGDVVVVVILGSGVVVGSVGAADAVIGARVSPSTIHTTVL